MENLKYYAALVLAFVYVFLVVSVFLGLLAFSASPRVDVNSFYFIAVVSIFSIIGTFYLFKQKIVYIYKTDNN